MTSLPSYPNNTDASRLVARLSEDGFTQYPAPAIALPPPDGVIRTYWQKRMDVGRDDLPVCQCNDKMTVNIIVTSGKANTGHSPQDYHGVDIEISAETVDSEWVELVYRDLPIESCISRYPILVERLLLAWCAVAD